MSVFGQSWLDVIITIASDDDLSAAVDLDPHNEFRAFDYLQIVIPELDECTITVYTSHDGITYQALGNSVTTGLTTGEYNTTFNLGGWRYIKIGTSASQSADRTFKVRGEKI